MFDLISIGDCTIDTFLAIHDATVNCTLFPDKCVICISYADKIPVDSIERQVAGNAANNSVGAARLGLKTAIYTVLGRDENGKWIAEKLKKEKVSGYYIRWDNHDGSNASTVINYKGERTILTYHAPRTYRLPNLDGTHFAYYTSAGKHHADLNRDIVSFIKKSGQHLAYNPGTYQLKAGMRAMKPVLKACYVLFVNKEEAMTIVGPKEDIRQYLTALHALGPKIAVITDGQNGSFAFDGAQFYKMGLVHIKKVVERTGAGDAYATAFVAALHYGKSVSHAMCWGSCNSASVIEYVGPQHGLLRKSEIEKYHRAHKHACAEVF